MLLTACRGPGWLRGPLARETPPQEQHSAAADRMRLVSGRCALAAMAPPLLLSASALLLLVPSRAASSSNHGAATHVSPVLQSALASCGDMDIVDSLRSVGIQAVAAERAAALLALLGFTAAPDL
eukprot:SAG31_NODE_13474_length_866_cov_2.538462_1_plen_124_part_10